MNKLVGERNGSVKYHINETEKKSRVSRSLCIPNTSQVVLTKFSSSQSHSPCLCLSPTPQHNAIVWASAYKLIGKVEDAANQHGGPRLTGSEEVFFLDRLTPPTHRT